MKFDEDKVYVSVSVSGGRTSAYMAQWMINNKGVVAQHIGVPVHRMEYVFLFANTGMEHEDTLRFLDDVDTHLLGGELVWVECVPFHGERKASGHAVVDFEIAHGNRDYEWRGHPFTNYIKKYGIPNVKFKSCTRELKLNPMKSYLASQGIKNYYTAVGIREDENRRVSKHAQADRILYPLVDLNPVDKQDVLDFMSQYSWDLTIPEWQGNCLTCYKKSFKKLKKVHEETPEAFNFTRSMEEKYSGIGPEFTKYKDSRPRTFYRMNNSTDQLIAAFNIVGDTSDKYLTPQEASCSESCELYEMESLDFVAGEG